METDIRVKPLLFESACVFSFLGSTIGLLFMLSFVLFFDDMYTTMGQFTSLSSLQPLNRFYFAILMAAYSISLAGVFKLYRMQRSGLYFYLMAQAMIFIFPLVWIGMNVLSVTNLIFILLFSGIYIYYYRLLN